MVVSYCTVVGAWVGAFPIPLDWDRPWQRWPISCIFGLIAGNVLGSFAGTLMVAYYIITGASGQRTKGKDN